MWKELKFAINWNAGDTKPIRQGRNSSRLIDINDTITAVTMLSRSRSRSMLSKSNAESLNKFGLIGEPDQKSTKSRKVFRRNFIADISFFARIPTMIALTRIPMEKA